MRIAITMAEKILIYKDCKEPDGVQLCKTHKYKFQAKILLQVYCGDTQLYYI